MAHGKGKEAKELNTSTINDLDEHQQDVEKVEVRVLLGCSSNIH